MLFRLYEGEDKFEMKVAEPPYQAFGPECLVGRKEKCRAGETVRVRQVPEKIGPEKRTALQAR